MFAFGHGLSYAKFAYDMDGAEIAKFSEDESWAVSLPVKNVGERAGKETVQIYAAYPNAKVERPVKELKAFAKTRLLAPGEQQTLTVKLRPRDLAYWDSFLRRYRLDAGEYQLIVAASAADIRGRAKVTVAKDYVFEN
jgi:beta-glucosidase